MQKQAIFIMGPTATGKTALGIELCQQLPVDIISVDSAMVYKGLDIGTGKPSKEELLRFPHKLIDICDPSTVYSVAQFCQDAKAAMQQSWDAGRIPLLVGGTMLYFRALQFGLSDLPQADPVLRAELYTKAQVIGWPAMHAQLAAMDPLAAEELNPNDAQRVQRALEINILTGKTLQQNYAGSNLKEADYHIHALAIMPTDRATLHAKIATRFDQMLEAGLIAEVERLYARKDLHTGLPAIRAVGYRQVWEYLAGEVEYASMRERAIAATRQLAKRQYTWLRTWPNLQIFPEASLLLTLHALQQSGIKQ